MTAVAPQADVCLCQVNFPGLSVTEFLSVCESAGAGSVDLHPRMTGEPLDGIVAAVERSPIRVRLVSPLPDWYAHTRKGTQLPPGFEELAEVSAATGGRIGAPSPLRERGEPGPAEESLAAGLRLLHERAASVGAAVALEPVGRSLVRPGAVGCIPDLERAREFLRSHDLPLRLVADSFCLATAGVDLAAPWSLDQVCLVQLADADRDAGARLLPGAGGLPLADWLRAAQGVPAAIGIEVFPLSQPERPAQLARELVSRTLELVRWLRD